MLTGTLGTNKGPRLWYSRGAVLDTGLNTNSDKLLPLSPSSMQTNVTRLPVLLVVLRSIPSHQHLAMLDLLSFLRTPSYSYILHSPGSERYLNLLASLRSFESGPVHLWCEVVWVEVDNAHGYTRKRERTFLLISVERARKPFLTPIASIPPAMKKSPKYPMASKPTWVTSRRTKLHANWNGVCFILNLKWRMLLNGFLISVGVNFTCTRGIHYHQYLCHSH